MVVAQERYNHYSLPEEESRVQRRPKRNKLPGKGRNTLTMLVLLTFCTGMLIAFYYSQVVISGYKIYSLNNRLVSLSQETVSLSQEVDRLNSLDRIEYVATTKLKMVKPNSGDVVVVKASLVAENSGVAPTGHVQPTGQSGQQARKTQSGAEKSKVVQAFANLIGIKGS